MVRLDRTLQRDNLQHGLLPLGENDPFTATCFQRCQLSHSRVWILRISIQLAPQRLYGKQIWEPDEDSNFLFSMTGQHQQPDSTTQEEHQGSR